MEEAHREKLKANMVFIVENLVIDATFLASLYQARVITSHDQEEVRVVQSKFNKNRRLVTILTSRGPKAYDAFIKALEETRQTDIVKTLTKK